MKEKIKHRIKGLIRPKNKVAKRPYDDTYVKVFSHPRSGTHFLEAFLARNFYADDDLKVAPVMWGHWSNKKEKAEGNPNGKLFGSHMFPDKVPVGVNKICIFRDPRAVAYSLWKTPNMIHLDEVGISFSDFLIKKLDWYSSPSIRTKSSINVLEHWYRYTLAWSYYAKKHDNVLVIRYEDLVDTPYEVYLKIHSKFFANETLLSPEQLDPVKKPVGLLPNSATKDSWKEAFSEADLKLVKKKYYSILNN